MARVFVDTNVLFPFSVMDLMLGLTEDAVHEILWTERLLAEWERVIVRRGRRSAESAAAITAAIRDFFDEGRVAEEDYVGLIPEMPGRDPDDKHHMAAAVAGNASVIVTRNRADFPAADLARYGIQVMDPDEYLCELIVELPNEVVETIVRTAGQKRRPPMTPYDIADSLSGAGVTNFAVHLRNHLDLRGAARPVAVTMWDDVDAPMVAPTDVGAYLAAHRPPDHNEVLLAVPPHEPVGAASHLVVVKAALLELLKIWPAGTTLVIDYGDDAYAQVLAYPPHVLTEIGPITSAQMAKAVESGWIDPTAFSAVHADFKSQPVWVDNPVREWSHPSDRPMEMAMFLVTSVQTILGRDPGDGYVLHVFNNLLAEQPGEG
jgi:predicted nucleic acid-binding protein